jgi:DNA polymerase-3 subunit alpha
MKHLDFVHLHLHTEYSLFDSTIRIAHLIKRISELKMSSVAITDHGSMFGAMQFYQQAKNAGIMPIIGCEVSIAPDSRSDSTTHDASDASHHLVLLAKDNTGYNNLCKLLSAAYLGGFQDKPQLDLELLSQHAEGLIGLTACLKGAVPYWYSHENEAKAREIAGQYSEIFGKENFYLELQYHQIKKQEQVNKFLLKLAKDFNLPVVATNNCHYLNREDAVPHDVLLCIGTGKRLRDTDRMRYASKEFYVKSPEDMASCFADYPDALRNTLKIAEYCHVELEFGNTALPEYAVPEEYTTDLYLRTLARKGLEERLNTILDQSTKAHQKVQQQYEERLTTELDIIEKLGCAGYFLLVWDVINYARQQGILTGPGRGGVASSLVAYSLHLTDIDPIPYQLPFERFLNSARETRPDIDVDVCLNQREYMIEYLSEKYGKDHVSHIAAFDLFDARTVVWDVGRVLNIPHAETGKIVKLIPNQLHITLEQSLQSVPELTKLRDNNAEVSKLLNISQVLEGLTCHILPHPTSIVVSPKPLVDYMPLYKGPKETADICTQYSTTDLEKIGLLKLDFIGLRYLTLIQDVLDRIKRTQGIAVDVLNLPTDDQLTFDLLSRGYTLGVFQLERSGMRDLLRKLKPKTFDDLIAALALYHPKLLHSGVVDDFITRKDGNTPVAYLHPHLESVLKDTYGVLLYQEQVMQISTLLVDYTPAEADLLRRALGGKNTAEIAKQQTHFLDGTRKKNIPDATAAELFILMKESAEHSCHKAHTAAYALLTYRTAYLKAHYPVEFMVITLNNDLANPDRLAQYINECHQRQIPILLPDVNSSRHAFSVADNSIQVGLASVKNIEETVSDHIINVREQTGSYTSLHDFCARVDLAKLSKRDVENFIKCGAFDFTGHSRAAMMEVFEQIFDAAQKMQDEQRSRQGLIFGGADEAESVLASQAELRIPALPEWHESKRLGFEQDVLGFSVTEHSLAKYGIEIRKHTTKTCAAISDCRDGEDVIIGGVVTTYREIQTKKGDLMGFFRLEDLNGNIEVILFPRVYERYSHLLKEDLLVLVTGRITRSQNEPPKIRAEKLKPLALPTHPIRGQCLIDLWAAKLRRQTVQELQKLLLQYHGDCPVAFKYIDPDNTIKNIIRAGERFAISPSDELTQRIEGLIGKNTIFVSLK